MRTQRYGRTVKVWLSAHDTYEWAHRTGAAWPCSTLSDKRLFAEFQNGDLVDLAINGRSGDCDAHEFNAMIEDFLGSARPGDEVTP